jgi:hypothetical protein
MNPFIPAIAFTALVAKFIDWLKMITQKEWNAVITQVIVWVSGIGALFLVGQTQWAKAVDIGATSIAHMGGWDKVFVGLAMGSAASWVTDAFASLNKTNTGVMRKMRLGKLSWQPDQTEGLPKHAQQ